VNPLVKHAQIFAERLLHGHGCKLAIGRIHQAVVLAWSENGRHEQQAALPALYEIIAESGEFR